MAPTIRTASVSHQKCGKEIVRIIDGVLHVQCLRRGCREWVPIYGWAETGQIMRVMELILTDQVRLEDVLALADPLVDYRQIEGLIVIGPTELDKACHGPNGENPLELQPGWIPNVPVPADLDQWIRSLTWRDSPEWATRATLVLTPPEIGGIPTSLIGQNKIWGVSHDRIPAGRVRQDVFWSNYFVQPNYDWAREPATDGWRWTLAYEHPLWMTKLNWDNQKQAALQRGMQISSVAQDAFVLNAVLAATGIRLRSATWSRTCTVYGGYPLNVHSCGNGVGVDGRWAPGGAGGLLAASVQGMPPGLVA